MTKHGFESLVEAVKLGQATATLLGELQAQEAALKALDGRIAEMAGRRETKSPAAERTNIRWPGPTTSA